MTGTTVAQECRTDSVTAPLLRARGVSVGYSLRVLIAKADLTLGAGDQVVLTGRSGSGKTSLLLVLAGLLEPLTGDVAWPGLASDPAERRRQISMVFQAPSLVPELTAEENVALPLRLYGWTRADAYAAAREVLDDLGLGPRERAGLPAELSGGQQQRVACGRALACRPRVLLADEPTSALDAASGQHVIGVLRERQSQAGAALLVATHDRRISRLLPQELRLDSGRITAGQQESR
jgi:ABC-type lipoprotein export system ATPase subunit